MKKRYLLFNLLFLPYLIIGQDVSTIRAQVEKSRSDKEITEIYNNYLDGLNDAFLDEEEFSLVSDILEYAQKDQNTELEILSYYLLIRKHLRNNESELGIQKGLKAIQLCQKTNDDQMFLKINYWVCQGYYNLKDFFKAKQYIELGIEYAAKMSNKVAEANLNIIKGDILANEGKDAEAIDLMKASIIVLEQSKDSVDYGYGCFKLSKIYDELKNQKEKIIALHKAKDALQNSVSKKLLSAVYISIAGYYYEEGRYQESIYHQQLGIHICKDNELNLEYIINTYNLGNTYYELGLLEKALNTYNQALIKAKRYNKDYCSFINGSIGEIYFEKGEYYKALSLYQEFLKQSPNNLRYHFHYSRNKIAELHYELKNYEKVIYYTDIVLSEKENYPQSITDKFFANMIKAKVHRSKNQFEQAEELLNNIIYEIQVESSKSNYTFLKYKCIAYYELGISKRLQKKYNEALLYQKESLKLGIELGLRKQMTETYIETGKINNLLAKYDFAIENFNKGLDNLENAEYKKLFKDIYQGLSAAYAAKGLYNNAYQYHVQYKKFEDSLITLKKTQEITHIESEYSVRNKEKENELLKLEQSKSKLIIQRQTLINVLAVVALCFISLVTIFLRRSNEEKQTLNELLEKRVEKRSEALLIANQELNEIQNTKLLEEAKFRFFTNISHEFRTPLTLIQGPIQKVLTFESLSIKGQKMLDRALNNSRQLLVLVSQILDLSKLEAGKLTLDEEPVMFYIFIRKIIANFETYAQRKGLLFKLEYQPKNNLKIELDKDKCEKILNNYISNALKFTSVGDIITIIVTDLENRIQIAVQDTGRGIPADEINKIFDRYYQVKEEKNDSLLGEGNHYVGGTGIGLSFCRDYAALFEGKVWAESIDENGSTFYFEFPKKEFFAATNDSDAFALEELEKPPLLTNTETTTSTLQKKNTSTILIVEDNYDLRAFLTELLEDDYNIVSVENGQKALDQLEKSSYELIISDVMMPIMDGFKLLEHLKSNQKYRHIPVIMLTARVEMRDKLKALRIGVDDYLLKPFDERELKVRVSNLILKVSKQQETIALEEGRFIEIDKIEHSDAEANWLVELENLTLKLINNFNFTANDLAEELYMSRSQLFRRVKKLTALTLNEYITEVRLQKARILIEQKNVTSVKEVAYSIGFKQTNYFSKIYETRFGKRPSEYF